MKIITWAIPVALLVSLKIQAQTCNDYKDTCNNFPVNSIHYQSCWLQKFLTDDNYLNINIDTVCKFYNYDYGMKSAYLKTKTPWIENYFLFKVGGIAARWQSKGFVPYPNDDYFPTTGYPSNEDLNWEKIKLLSKEELSKLSPSEKLDIYLGYTDFRITRWELRNRGPKMDTVSAWDGYCNGVRAAGALVSEPTKEITVSSKTDNTIQFVFYPADLKALAAASCYYVTRYFDAGQNNNANNPNPVIFDMVVRLLISKDISPIFFDRYSKTNKKGINEIWNTSIVGYTRRVAITNNPSNNSKNLNVTMTIYEVEDVDNLKDFNKQTVSLIKMKDKDLVATKTYNYTISIDSNGNMIDGKWNGNYPDFIWLAAGKGTQKQSDGILYGDPNLDFDEIVNLIELAK